MVRGAARGEGGGEKEGEEWHAGVQEVGVEGAGVTDGSEEGRSKVWQEILLIV